MWQRGLTDRRSTDRLSDDVVQVDLDMHHRTIEVPVAAPPTVREDSEHQMVLCQNVGDKVVNPVVYGHFSQELK